MKKVFIILLAILLATLAFATEQKIVTIRASVGGFIAPRTAFDELGENIAKKVEELNKEGWLLERFEYVENSSVGDVYGVILLFERED